MKRTSKYYEDVTNKLASAPKKFSEKYTVDTDDFGMPPMLEFARAANDDMQNPSVETKMMVMKYAILGREVTISYDSVPVSRFKMNNITDDLDTFPGLKGPALLFLMKQTWFNFLEKLLPPEIGAPPAAETSTQPGSSKKR